MYEIIRPLKKAGSSVLTRTGDPGLIITPDVATLVATAPWCSRHPNRCDWEQSKMSWICEQCGVLSDSMLRWIAAHTESIHTLLRKCLYEFCTYEKGKQKMLAYRWWKYFQVIPDNSLGLTYRSLLKELFIIDSEDLTLDTVRLMTNKSLHFKVHFELDSTYTYFRGAHGNIYNS